jgi:hypothetical protein
MIKETTTPVVKELIDYTEDVNKQLIEKVFNNVMIGIEYKKSIQTTIFEEKNKDMDDSEKNNSHPILNITKSMSDYEIINIIKPFIEVSEVIDGVIVNYDIPDIYELIGPMTQVLSIVSGYGRDKVVEYILQKYPIIDVSYADNFCFLETMRYGHINICKLLVSHDSFTPDKMVIEKAIDHREILEEMMKCVNYHRELSEHFEKMRMMDYADLRDYIVNDFEEFDD